MRKADGKCATLGDGKCVTHRVSWEDMRDDMTREVWWHCTDAALGLDWLANLDYHPHLRPGCTCDEEEMWDDPAGFRCTCAARGQDQDLSLIHI